jgi:hypothetical protein
MTAATTLLGLALPVTGDLSGTWGDVVNNSITNLLDSAVAGTTTLTTDADVTLTTTNLAANQAREAILLWTATGSTTRNITAPAHSKVYVVINASGGTQSIVLRGAGPTTGVTIIKGEVAVCAWNGSDFIKVANTAGDTSANNLTVAGSIGISGAIKEGVYALSGTTPALNPVNGTIQTWTLTGLSSPTDSFTSGQSMTLMVDDGTGYTITWPTMTWVGGSAPVLATSGYTIVELWKVNSTLYGALVGNA